MFFWVGMHQKRLMGNIPGVGTGVTEYHQIANPERLDINPAGEHILGSTKLADQGNGMIGNDWGCSLPVVGGQNVKRMIVGLGRRSPEVVGAAPADGKPFLAASLNVQNFANIKTTGSGYETTTLEPDFPGTIRVSLKQFIKAGTKPRPVKLLVGPGVIYPDSAPDIYLGNGQVVPGFPRTDGFQIVCY
jgi:hypothetical protein